MPALITYPGNNATLKKCIVGFEKLYEGCCKSSIKPEVKRILIPKIESELINIINMARGSDHDQMKNTYDQLWLAANRIEINGIFEKLKEIRLQINSPMDLKQKSIMEKQQSHFLNPEKIFDTASIKKDARETTKKTYGALSAKKALAVTGASTVSLFAGPPGALAVTATGILSFSAAWIATRKKMSENESIAVEKVETSLRKVFTNK